MKTHRSVAPKSSFAFTALNPTLLNSVTEEPLLFSSTEPQTSSGIPGKGFSSTSHPETTTNWNPVTLSPYLKGTSTDMNPNTVSDMNLNTPPVSVTPLQLDEQVTELSPSPPHNDITVHPAVFNKTTIIHATHKGTSVQPEAIT